MKLDPNEGKGAAKWLFRVGLIAVVFCISLYKIDQYLSTYPREQILRDTLYELRSAQTNLKSGVTDPRQLGMAEGEIETSASNSKDLHH